nr:immunoglobulin heavy chain junction region [Mus musculus]
CTGPGTTG